MSSLLRSTMDKPPPRPRQDPSSASALDADEASYSSDSASSAASANTVRPASPSQTPAPHHWSNFFTTELNLETTLPNGNHANYHAYITPPSNPSKDPLFVCHHGAGASAMSFAPLATHLKQLQPNAGILSLTAINHGPTTKTLPSGSPAPPDYSLETLTNDALTSLQLTQAHFTWPTLPPTILLGHSLGGAVLTNLTSTHWRALPTLIGYAILDVVEGSALEALGHMKSYLASRPAAFPSPASAVDWHIRSRTLRNRASADITVPNLLVPSISNPEQYLWRTDLTFTEPSWWDWFTGLSGKFLTGRAAKLLILAGTDRLDRELMIGQMQGKFQLVVVPEAGHFVHEDSPERVAEVVVEFWRRNDRSGLVLPPKVSELLAQGKKV